MGFKKLYESTLRRERLERNKHMQEYVEKRKEDERNKPDFNDFCKKISKFRAAKLLNKVYKARTAAGLPAFTHVYDYPLRDTCWLAKKDFKVSGRYGANSGDFVFVRDSVEVTGGDHTTVIYIDDWERNEYFVPAYSNTV